MANGFKPTTDCRHNSGGKKKYKAGVDFVRPVELKEKKSAVMAKSPQSEAVAGVQKKDYRTMLPK